MWHRKIVGAIAALLISSTALVAQSIQLGPGQVLGNPTAIQRPGIQATLTSMWDRAFCSTVGYAVFRFTGEWKCSRSIPLDITWFGAIADSGVTDNVTTIQAAYDYAAANGLAIKIPRSSGYFAAGCGRNNAMIDGTSLTVANGNKSVSIYGDGWSEKPFATPTGSWILPTSSFPNTCSYIRLSGSDKVAGTVYKGFGIGEFGGSLGTPKGLHGLFIDATNPAFYLQDFTVDNVFIGNTAAGYSFKITTGSSATPGGMPDSLITNSKFMNFNADFLGDHVTITGGNTVGQNATNDSRNVGFQFANCDGCTTTIITQNNISNTSGALIYDGGGGLVFGPNEVEQPPFTNLNGVSVWLRGSFSAVIGATVEAPKISMVNAVNTVSPITVGTAQDTSIRNPWILLPSGSADPHITVTSGASGTSIRDPSCWFSGVHTFDCTITNNGAYTGYLDTLGIGISGRTDSKMGRLEAPLNALGLSWRLGSVSGTLVGTSSLPIVIDTPTGRATCPTCATTAGANIPALGTGDILYGSATNVLSALADVAAGNALISGGVGAAPLWGKIGISTHVSGFGANVATFLGTPSSANLLAALTTSTGSGNAVFSSGPAITGGSHDALTSFGIRSTGAAFDLKQASAEVLTANHTLTWVLGNADRTLTLGGNTTLNGGTHSGTNTGDQTITLSGDVSGTGTGAITALIGATKVTSAMLNADVFSTAHSWAGIQTLATPVLNGLPTGTGVATANTASTLVARDASGNAAFGTVTASLTGHASLDLALSALGSNVQTALSVSVGSAGAFVVNGGALGTPSSGTATNLTGTAAGLTAGGNITSVVCNGLTVTATGTCPEPLEFENCTLSASVASNILTVALKDGAGSNLSATSPCRIGFANATASTGTSTFNSVTGALSIDTNATGASLGSSNSTAFRFWVVAFDNSGTTVLSLYNASTAATGCSPIDESAVQTSVAMSGSATAAKTYYTPNGTTVSSKSVRLLGFIEYGASGLATAGTYASAPATVRTFTKGMKRPCDEVQVGYGEIAGGTASTSTSNAFGTGAAPTFSPVATITPKSAANLIQASWATIIQTNDGSAAVAYCQLFRGASGSVNTAVGSLVAIDTNVAGSTFGGAAGLALDGPNIATAIQYALRTRNSDNASTVSCPNGNGTSNIALKEIQG